jgi:hypothetical protein
MKIALSSILLGICVTPLAHAEAGSTPGSNLSFEEVQDEGVTNWNLRDGNYFSGGKASVSAEDSIHGQHAMELVATTPGNNNPQSDPYFSQCINVENFRGKTLTLTAAFKMKTSSKSSPYTYASIWMRAWPETDIVRSKRQDKTTNGWKKIKTAISITNTHEQLCFGGKLSGTYARALFDNFELTVN